MELKHLNLRVRDAAACRDFYLRHFRFRQAFEAEGGYFLRSEDGFLLALVPAEPHEPLSPGFHIGFVLPEASAVDAVHRELTAAGVGVTQVDDSRPEEDYVTFRCWDPDGTEIEIYWDG